MFTILVLVCVSGTRSADDVIQKYDVEDDGLGNYAFDVATGDEGGLLTGFRHKQRGRFVDEELDVEGEISYRVDEELVVSVKYVADKDGYRPKVQWLFLPKSGTRTGTAGAPIGKTDISSTVLATLTGGNGK